MWKCCGNSCPSWDCFRSGLSGTQPQARAPRRRRQMSALCTAELQTRGGILPKCDVNSKRKLYECKFRFPHAIHSFSTGQNRRTRVPNASTLAAATAALRSPRRICIEKKRRFRAPSRTSLWGHASPPPKACAAIEVPPSRCRFPKININAVHNPCGNPAEIFAPRPNLHGLTMNQGCCLNRSGDNSTHGSSIG